jgi:RNA polymerase subunit RPABC4/transcription elongation factor Spt4
MKKCPNCKVDVNDNFDICWNCQYSFVEFKILDNEDFRLVCPACNSEIDVDDDICPACHAKTSISPDYPKNVSQDGLKEIDCLRCHVQLEFKGLYSFHEGSTIGKGILFPDLTTNREDFELYACPNCGKVEFFVPGF